MRESEFGKSEVGAVLARPGRDWDDDHSYLVGGAVPDQRTAVYRVDDDNDVVLSLGVTVSANRREEGFRGLTGLVSLSFGPRSKNTFRRTGYLQGPPPNGKNECTKDPNWLDDTEERACELIRSYSVKGEKSAVPDIVISTLVLGNERGLESDERGCGLFS